MSFLLSLLLPLLTTVVVVGTTATLWRSTLPSVWVYVGVSSLIVLGLHRVLQIGTEAIKLFNSGGYFLEHQKQPNVVEAVARSLTIEALIVSLLLALLSWPVLGWLRTLLAR